MFEENKELNSAPKDKEKEDFDKKNERDIIKTKLEGKTSEEKKAILEKMAENLADDLKKVLKDKKNNQNKKAA